jgi:hypothetical protein
MELIISLVALVLSLLTALAALAYGGLEGRRQHIREIEQFYLSRYWELQDQAPIEALRGDGAPTNQETVLIDTSPAQIVKDEALGTINVSRLALLYLRMCDDEVRNRERGMISDAVWMEWINAMQTQITRWPVSHEWQVIKARDRGRDFEDLDRALPPVEDAAHPPLTDPCDWRRWRRYWHGLARSPWPHPFGRPPHYCAHDWGDETYKGQASDGR